MSLSAVLCAAACAKGEDGIDVGDAAVAAPDGGEGVRPIIPASDAGGGKDSAVPDAQDSGGCTGKILINEIMTTGASATAELVELYNPSACAAAVGGWKVAYKPSIGGASNTVLFTFKAGTSVAAKSFFVLGTEAFGGAKDATMTAGMKDEGGQVGLLDEQDAVADAVGYGGAKGTFVEGVAAAAPVANGSLGRKSDGVDSDNNASDFKASATHSAGAPNN